MYEMSACEPNAITDKAKHIRPYKESSLSRSVLLDLFSEQISRRGPPSRWWTVTSGRPMTIDHLKFTANPDSKDLKQNLMVIHNIQNTLDGGQLLKSKSCSLR